MSGGPGTDTVSYAERSTPVVVTLPAPGTLASMGAGTLSTLVAGEGGSLGEGDRLSGDIEVLVGGSADDTLTGNDGPNLISGAGGNDTIGGSGGNDSVSGGAGNDALSGGPGVDTIDGGEGTNVCDRNEGEAEVASCQYDVSPPVLVSVDGPAVATAGTSVTFTYRLTDAIGVSNANLFLVTSNGQFVPGCVTSTRASGSALDGTYTSACQIPGALADGAYRVTIYAVDLAGNTRYANDAVAILTVTGGTNDTDAPGLASVAGPGSATPVRP